ncbi:MAG: M48 family metalloprotease [Ignavibacteriales bacterium]|nr:Beta-barrel assembly-enhancing protease [Ignavibacteriaceae bacterium]MBW7872660.1 M48 family metalloprotease [Ignavibacteria bacterium]MBZ0197761.1 M48 family metalloprotease [Ignavibacteriaceae bacterium]MCZ2143382.1 M48 family metalloprotease [Ignavibacteriales bacterium]WKZ72293.1 MAG: M48 family metalloprotease [Ignavibacteriaceae bacterium]
MKTTFNFFSTILVAILFVSFISTDTSAQRKKNEADINWDSVAQATYGKAVYGTPQNKMVDEVAKVLNKAAGLSGSSAIHFKLIKNEEINAFAYINDSIYVHTGLFKSLNNSIDQLAFVLGHELAHVLMRHPAKTDEFMKKNPNATEAQLLQLSRDQEFEADKYAVLYTMRAGYSPLGGIEWFNYMTNTGAEYTPHTMNYVTHPNFTSRVVEVFKHIATYYEYARNFEFGLIYLNDGDYKNSIASFNKFLSAYPNFKEGYNNLAVAILSQKINQNGIKLEVLLPMMVSKVDFFTNIFTVNTKRGEYNLKSSELTDAVKALNKAVELDPNYTQAYLNLAILNTLTKNIKSATEAVAQAEKVSPKSYEVMITKGFLQIEQNKFKEAAAIFKNAMTADPSRPEALYNMALAYTFGQMKNEAISTWKSFLSKFKDTYYAGEAQKKLDVLEGKKAPQSDKKDTPAPSSNRPQTRERNKAKAAVAGSEVSMAGISVGMSSDEVLRKLKLPTTEDSDAYGPFWIYSTPNLVIYFDQNNTVTSVTTYDPTAKISLQGKTIGVNTSIEDLKALLGEPDYMDEFSGDLQLIFEKYGIIAYIQDGLVGGLIIY